MKLLLLPMFIIPSIAAGAFFATGQYASMTTWGGVAIANFGIWLQTT